MLDGKMESAGWLGPKFYANWCSSARSIYLSGIDGSFRIRDTVIRYHIQRRYHTGIQIITDSCMRLSITGWPVNSKLNYYCLVLITDLSPTETLITQLWSPWTWYWVTSVQILLLTSVLHKITDTAYKWQLACNLILGLLQYCSRLLKMRQVHCDIESYIDT